MLTTEGDNPSRHPCTFAHIQIALAYSLDKHKIPHQHTHTYDQVRLTYIVHMHW